MNLEGKNVLVMGLGVHGGGLGVTRFLVSRRARVTVTDLKTAEQLETSLARLNGLPVRFVLGEHRVEDFLSADLVVRNPGVPRESKYLDLARQRGIPIEMEMSLFFELCPAPVVGITGTKGKTTTTLLTGAILRQDQPGTVVAGNLRISALEALPQIREDTPVVLELSSWQLEALAERRLAPHVAVVTNVFPDHLNRYSDMASYVESKKDIFRHQQRDDVVVLNFGSEIVRAFSKEAPGKVVWFGCGELEGVRACYVRDETVIWRDEGEEKTVCSTRDVRLLGAHNLENVLAAVAATASMGVPVDRIKMAVERFEGVPDRLELVRTVDGVAFYNDTTSTTPGSTAAALEAFQQPIILVAGGSDKGLAFGELASVIARRAKCMIALEGTATPNLLVAVRRAGDVPVLGPFAGFVEALEVARDTAKSGDVVLLSPACASFGMFANEFERGQRFREIVNSF